MTRRCSIGLATVVVLVFAARSARGRSELPTPAELVHSATLIGEGVVLAVDPGSDDDHRCARIIRGRILRGDGSCRLLRICYPAVRNIELGPGPLVEVGESVVFFGTAESDCRVELVDPYNALVSPSNVRRTTRRNPRDPTFDEFRQSVEWTLALVEAEADPPAEEALLREIVASDSAMVWVTLDQAHLGWRPTPQSRSLHRVDAEVLARLLVERVRDPSRPDRGAMLDLLGFADRRGRYLNEVMDYALELMGSADNADRHGGLAVAMRYARIERLEQIRPNMRPQMVGYYGIEDFDFDPEGPPEERAAALERWRTWWAQNRGRGEYDREARIAEALELERTAPQRAAERRRALGEMVKAEIEAGRTRLDEVDDVDREYLRLAGYELTPDGRVVPLETATMDEEAGICVADAGAEADAAGDAGDGDGGDGMDDRAAPATPGSRGCGCATAGGSRSRSIAALLLAGILLLLRARPVAARRRGGR